MGIIGDRIAEIRKRKGLAQEELASKAIINLRTIQRIEAGETDPRGHTLRNICDVLEINIEDIVDYGKRENRQFLKQFHLSVVSGIIFPWGNLIFPIILWMSNRDKIMDLRAQGANLINFQIFWTIIQIIFVGFYFAWTTIHGPGSYMDLVYPMLVMLCLYGFVIIVYPIIVSILIARGPIRNYYPTIIKIVK